MQHTHDADIVADGDMSKKDVARKVYEIGYIFLSSIPQEKVAEHSASLHAVLSKAGATVIAQGEPELTPLAYTMTKKLHGANHRFDEGYFGWVKFELSSDAIASVKKAFDTDEAILRYILMTTVKENIYLGKRAPAYSSAAVRDAGMIAPEVAVASATATIAPQVAAASVEDMDKSIEAMVKGA